MRLLGRRRRPEEPTVSLGELLEPYKGIAWTIDADGEPHPAQAADAHAPPDTDAQPDARIPGTESSDDQHDE